MPEVQTNDSEMNSHGHPLRFWTRRQIATNCVFLILAGIAAYLQYYLYPLVMTRPIGSSSGLGFGETDVSIKFSFLTFQYSATRCMGTSCSPLVGISAFDFVQLLIIIIVVMNVLHFLSIRKARRS